MKQINEQVWWKYVDGDCNKEEKLQIESLLAEDPSLAEEMMLRSTLHHEMSEMELIVPSMDFTKNVMDALPKAIKISEVAPLVSPRMKWLFFIVSSLLLIGLLVSPFFLEGSVATAPSQASPVIAEVSLWFDAIILSISQFIPSIPEIQIPVIPTSFLQLIGVLILGTLILLSVDKVAGKKMQF